MDAEIITALIGALSAILAAIVAYISVRESTRQEQDTRARVTEAESRVEAQPERAKPTWDLARVTLDAYFNRNLTQINAIFWLSVVVMLVGFLIIIGRILQAIRSPNIVAPAVMASAAGVVTEFIGATFPLSIGQLYGKRLTILKR